MKGMVFMELKEFMDISKLQKIQDNFSDATGLAAIAVGNDGQYLTEGSNFTEFCMKYTRGSKEGNRRCVKCDNEGSGTLKRLKKDSFYWYKKVIASNGENL